MRPGQREGDEFGVFISYSRHDSLEFSKQLAIALEAFGYRAIIDVQGISGGEAWKARLSEMILDCDTVVFVLSPESAVSPICAWEVEQATQLGKRILPAIAMPLGAAKPPERLAQLNYIHFYPERSVPDSGFGQGLALLNVALRSDLVWLREHRNILMRADAWDKTGRGPDRLLHGTALADAERWAASRPVTAPELTNLQREYISASRADEDTVTEAKRRELAERERLVTEAEAAKTEREQAQAAREAAQREALAATRRVVQRTRLGLVSALVLAAITGGVSLYALDQKSKALAQRQAAQQSLKVAIAWEYTEKEPSVSAAFLREIDDPDHIRGWRGATNKTLEKLNASSKLPLRGHDGLVLSAEFSPDASRIVTASYDKTAGIWDSSTGVMTARLVGHKDIVTTAAFTPDGYLIVTASRDETVRLWQAASGKQVAVLRGLEGVTSASSSPDGTRIVTTSGGTAEVFDTATAKELFVLTGHTAQVTSAAFSRDGKLIVTASDDHTARLWDSSGGLIAILKGHTAELSSASFSPDGKRIVTGSLDNTVRLWDATTGVAVAVLSGHTGKLNDANFSPDGGRIITASSDQTARLWDERTGLLIAVLQHPAPVWTASFSPDGEYALTASEDGKARLWRQYGLIDSVFDVSGSGLISASYSADGSKLVTVSRDGEANVLELFPGTKILQTQLWQLSPRCPDVHARKDLLGQSTAQAEYEDQICQQRVTSLDNPSAQEHNIVFESAPAAPSPSKLSAEP
jgi:WD40 repeat protein